MENLLWKTLWQMSFDGVLRWFYGGLWELPSGKRLHNYGKSPFYNGILMDDIRDDTLWLLRQFHLGYPTW